MPKRILFLFVLFISLITCRKDVDTINTDSSLKLSFSDNVVFFDTIFTTVGSTTRRLRVYNPGAEAVNISSISITGDHKAHFRMNVDGIPGTKVTDVLIAGKDSLYIFIDVTINPNLVEPFFVEGKIQFLTNGNLQEVSLLAYGRNANFIVPNVFPTNGLPPYSRVLQRENADTIWKKDLPIVIYGYAVIDSTQKLTIEAGTQIYLHANAGIWVYRYGQIEVKGTCDEPVVFQGDRLDEYKDIAGSWDRIWINDGGVGNHNVIDHAIIKNAFIGIQAEYNPFQGRKDDVSNNVLILTNTKIENCKANGIYALNYLISAENVLVENCGSSNFYASGAGFYDFKNCTFANYWRGEPRKNPAVYLTHVYFDGDAQVYVADSMTAKFHNCIIYGDLESEFNIENEIDPGDNINFTMDHTLFKTDIDVEKYGIYESPVGNPTNTTIFINPGAANFHLAPGSPAIDQGIGGPPEDLDCKPRTVPVDLGAYEFVQ